MKLSLPFKIELNRHFAIFLSVLILALAGLSIFSSWLAPQTPEKNAYEQSPDRSIFNAKPSGYQYWYQTIQLLHNSKKLPLPIHVWRDNFTMLAKLPGNNTMLLVEPSYAPMANGLNGQESKPFSTREITQLMDWVEQGNTLIYLDQPGRPHARVILDRLGLNKTKQKPPAKPKPITLQKAAPKPLSDLEKSLLPIEDQEKIKQQELQQEKQGLPKGVTIETWEEQPVLFSPNSPEPLHRYLKHSAFVKPTEAWGMALAQFSQNLDNETDVLLKTSQTPILMKISHGDGEVWLGTMPELAQNAYLKQKNWDNYQLFTNIILSTGKPIYINEFIHGNESSDNSLFGYYYQKTPLGRMGIQLCIVFLFLLWWSFSNWQPKRHVVLEADEPISLQAFVNSLSGLYQKAEAAPLVLKPYWVLVSKLLEKRCRINILPNRSTDEIEHLLERNLAGPSGLLTTLGYQDHQMTETIHHLCQVYQMLEKAKDGKNAKYCSEKELKDWVKTMATLLQALESRYHHPVRK